MEGLFWLSLLFTLLPGTESRERTEGCLSQPHKAIWHKTGQSAVLRCSSNCSDPQQHYQWFVFKEHDHFLLTLSSRHSLHGAFLHIKSLNVNDSGIYYCAAESNSEAYCCKQHIGTGTPLVVKEQFKIIVRNIYMWVLFIILAIYSIVIMALILKKRGCSVCKKTSKTEIRNSVRKKSEFRNVLQELHSKGNFKKGKQTRGNHSQVEPESRNISTDDIYQNV